VTEDRFTGEPDEPAVLDDDAVGVLELLDEEQAAAASPLSAMTEAARSVRLDFMRLILYFDCFYWINGRASIQGKSVRRRQAVASAGTPSSVSSRSRRAVSDG
jgi:hypothetical protein